MLTFDAAFDLWLSTLAPNTRRAYRCDLRDLADFLEVDGIADAVRKVIDGGPGEAYALAVAWRRQQLQDGLKTSTRNRRLASLKSVVKFLGAVGLCSWRLGLALEKVQPQLEGKIIPLGKLAEMIALATVRDRCLLWLGYSPALRVAEMCSLNVGDVDLERGLLSFIGKGQSEREFHYLPEAAKDALRQWLEVRGSEPGPLFLACTTWRGHRLTTRQMWRIVRGLGEKVGLRGLHPHTLRHVGITQASRELGGDVVAVAEFARHASIVTTQAYIHLAAGTKRRTVDAVGAALASALAEAH